MINEVNVERGVFIPDLHVPYQHNKAFNAALEFIDFIKPSKVWIIGDWVDFYQISDFERNPERIPELQDDITLGVEHLRAVRAIAPSADIYFIPGNHEYRLKRYLWTKAMPLASLKGLKLDELLKLEKFKIKYMEYGFHQYGKLLVTHGSLIRKDAGAAAAAEQQRSGMSGVTGHTHRLAQIFKRDESGYYTWMEIGCLCKIDRKQVEWARGQQFNWQHGLGVGFFKKNSNRFSISPLPIVNGKVFFDLKEIGGKQ